MKIADFNIRATPPQRSKRVKADLELAMALGQLVYCWQELGKFARYVRVLKAVFTRDRWRHLFEGKRNIITIRRRRFHVLEMRSKVLSPAAPWLPQPKRIANAVLLKDKLTDAVDWVVNFHQTNGAKNPRWFPRKIKEARQRRWHDEVEDMTDFIAELLAYCEAPVWLCADSNSPHMPTLHKDQLDLVSDAPMHISLVRPGGAGPQRVRRAKIAVDRLNTDHGALMVEEQGARQP